ncbi:MAG: hypothetical protein ABL857_01505 [Rickettsiales bacterium]
MTASFDHKKILKKIKRALCFFAAIVFLFEAWLWDVLYPIVAKLISWLPWDNVKKWVVNKVEHLPAWATVFIFIIPVIAIFPIKILGVWLVSKHHIFSGIIVFMGAKLVGLGVTAFLFETCKEKLLSLRWFLWLYNTVLKIKKWAGKQVAPAMREIRIIKSSILGQ